MYAKMAHDGLNKRILFYSEPKKNVKTAKNDSFSIFFANFFFLAFLNIFRITGHHFTSFLKLRGNITRNVKLLTFFVINTKEK